MLERVWCILAEGQELHLGREGTYLGRCLVPVSQQQLGREGQYAWEIPAKIVSEGSLLSSPQGCHFPLICRAQEGAGILWCKTRKSLSKREQAES